MSKQFNGAVARSRKNFERALLKSIESLRESMVSEGPLTEENTSDLLKAIAVISFENYLICMHMFTSGDPQLQHLAAAAAFQSAADGRAEALGYRRGTG